MEETYLLPTTLLNTIAITKMRTIIIAILHVRVNMLLVNEMLPLVY